MALRKWLGDLMKNKNKRRCELSLENDLVATKIELG